MHTPLSRSMASMPPQMEKISLPGFWSGPYSMSPRSNTSPGQTCNLKILGEIGSKFSQELHDLLNGTNTRAPTSSSSAAARGGRVFSGFLPILLPYIEMVGHLWVEAHSVSILLAQISFCNMFVSHGLAMMPSCLPKGPGAWKSNTCVTLPESPT